ncbi:glycoside hydrolase family 2 TIM barrel-domain containing protein [Cytophagaceae bacterium DM2B3-1]|uniref:Glycoside hydrolase family 2 TIM barrel-domain containing protein n=1 Tax=Xanthocytophaga flava TaxID=3048013 RepID=A0ABT7CHI4_9BACT|nr:glycoside hydrolase family 2 TIM barrel-domain containing protein [Xanthocytophaga flavus]MDJ1493199.1 glycoside hydrolase family 2 TIM barrel-domain containing protein [Xanthocytophaga flavus]
MKYIVKIFVLWLLYVPVALFGQSTSNQESLPLNGKWDFRIDPENIGEERGWHTSGFQATGWDAMEVPGNWDLYNQYATYSGKGWYRRSIEIPASWQGKTIRLAFEAVYHDAKVWLDGTLLGQSHSGFFPFEFDITKLIKSGQRSTLVVCADNTFRRGAIWNWGGIRRPVSLIATNPVHIEQIHILPVADLKSATASVTVKLRIKNNTDQPQSVKCDIVLKDKSGHILKASKNLSLSLTIPAQSSQEYSVQTSIPKSDTHLWHFDDPYLYTAQATLYMANTLSGKQPNKLTNTLPLLHMVSDRFGIRKVEIDGLSVKLNGEPVRLMGYNWVPDDRTTGNTLPAWRYRQDIDLMKKSGANMARLSHLPLPKEVLDYLDEKGMLVFSEIPLWGRDQLVDPDNPLPKEWLKNLVSQQFNHPSVIGWCVGNEIGFIGANPKVLEYVESAIGYVKKQLDSSRLVVYVSNSADIQQRDPVQFSDMILLNKYGDLGNNADKAHQKHPGKPLFYSEYGYNLTGETPDQGVINGTKMLNDMRGRDYLMGGALWTFNDYRSHWQAHQSWNTAPSGNRSWGVVNVYRQPKQAYEIFRRQYAPIRSLTASGTSKSVTISIEPRTVLDLPAYTLKNYTLVWQATDSQDRYLDGGFTTLPTIAPGSKAFQQSITWKAASTQIAKTTYTLLSPTGYAVYDTTVYLQKPTPPVIKQMITGEGGVRILFDKVASAQQYFLRYGKTDFSSVSDTTTHHFIDISKLEAGQSYQFQLVAINAAGESIPSATAKTTPESQLLPPIVWHAEAANNAFFIGYSYANYDYLYQIRYGTDPANEDTWKSLKVTTKGMCRIPNLQNGQTYYFRMKRTDQAYVESGWSEMHSIVLPGNTDPQAVEAKAVLRSGSKAVIAIHPVPQAAGYQVRYEQDSKTQSVIIQGSSLDYLPIDGLKSAKNYSFQVSTLGKESSGIVQKASTQIGDLLTR